MARKPKTPEPAPAVKAAPSRRSKKEPEAPEPVAESVKPALKAKAAAKSEQAAVATTASVGNIIDRNRYSYESHKDQKTASGRASVDNGDPVAVALRGKTAEQVVALVVENGGTPNDKWRHLANLGLIRMAAGNVLRNLMKSNGFLKVEGKRIKAPGGEPAPTKKAA